jgi:carboxyl-terminal processing protease
MDQERRRLPFPISLVLLCGIILGVLVDRAGLVFSAGTSAPADVGHRFDPFWQAWRLVESRYVDRKAIDPEKMTQGAISGMLASLGDVGHTQYLTPRELERLETGIKGNFEGIGAGVTMREGRPTVAFTLPNSPARAAGVQPGDVMLKVDDKPVDGLSVDQVIDLVRGPSGSKVLLTVARAGKTMQIEVTRARVDMPDVGWHMLPGVPIAHIAIHDFGGNADNQLRAALQTARHAGVKGLIIDLRGNPGGLKEQAVTVTSEFVRGGNVFIEQDAAGKRQEIAVSGRGSAYDIPLVLIIDKGTASAAEIFAGAIQDHGRGKLVGLRTFGTGTVLRPFRLSDGSAVLLAVAEWLTPKGRQIRHHGIPPDIEQSLPAQARFLSPEEEGGLDEKALAGSSDRQLLKAIEVLKAQIDQRP